MIEFEDIPAFLRVSHLDIPARRKATKEWIEANGHLVRRNSQRKLDYSQPRTLDATGKAMLRKLRHERAKKLLEKRKARKQKS